MSCIAGSHTPLQFEKNACPLGRLVLVIDVHVKAQSAANPVHAATKCSAQRAQHTQRPSPERSELNRAPAG